MKTDIYFSSLVVQNHGFGKAVVKHGIYNKFSNLLSKLCLNLTEGNVKLLKVVTQQTK